jgi:hypothetical protein
MNYESEGDRRICQIFFDTIIGEEQGRGATHLLRMDVAEYHDAGPSPALLEYPFTPRG